MCNKVSQCAATSRPWSHCSTLLHKTLHSTWGTPMSSIYYDRTLCFHQKCIGFVFHPVCNAILFSDIWLHYSNVLVIFFCSSWYCVLSFAAEPSTEQAGWWSAFPLAFSHGSWYVVARIGQLYTSSEQIYCNRPHEYIAQHHTRLLQLHIIYVAQIHKCTNAHNQTQILKCSQKSFVLSTWYYYYDNNCLYPTVQPPCLTVIDTGREKWWWMRIWGRSTPIEKVKKAAMTAAGLLPISAFC